MVTDQKITALDPVTAPANLDVMEIATDPAGSPISKKATLEDINRWGDARIVVTGGASGQTLSTSFEKVTQFTAAVSGLELVADHANDRVQLPEVGEYLALGQLSWSGVSGQEYQFSIRWNNVLQVVPVIQHCDHANEHNATLLIPINASLVNLYVELWAKADGAHLMTLIEAHLTVMRIR